MSAIYKAIPLEITSRHENNLELKPLPQIFNLEYGKIIIEPKRFLGIENEIIMNHLQVNISFLADSTKIKKFYNEKQKIFFIQIVQCEINGKNYYIPLQVMTPYYVAKSKFENTWMGTLIMDNRKETLFDFIDPESGWTVDLSEKMNFPAYNSNFDKNKESTFFDNLIERVHMNDSPSISRFGTISIHDDEKDTEKNAIMQEIMSQYNTNKETLKKSRSAVGIPPEHLDKLTDVTKWATIKENEHFDINFQTFAILANEKSELYCLGGVAWDFDTYGLNYPKRLYVEPLPRYTEEFVTCMLNWNKYAYQQGVTPLYFKNVPELQYKENTSSNSSSFDQTLDKSIKSKRIPNIDDAYE